MTPLCGSSSTFHLRCESGSEEQQPRVRDLGREIQVSSLERGMKRGDKPGLFLECLKAGAVFRFSFEAAAFLFSKGREFHSAWAVLDRDEAGLELLCLYGSAGVCSGCGGVG